MQLAGVWGLRGDGGQLHVEPGDQDLPEAGHYDRWAALVAVVRVL